MSKAVRPKGRTVALIGGDGSGKSSVARRLVDDSEFRFTYLYMGPSLSSASHLLPSSRVVLAIKRFRHPDSAARSLDSDTLESRDRPSSIARFLLRSLVQFSEVVHREVRVRFRLRRGIDVVFDRHVLFEIWPVEHPTAVLERTRNAYARLLRLTCRPPDRTLLLVADPEVMLSRKGETDTGYLERRNLEWLEMAAADPSMSLVDANRSLDEVYLQVHALVSSSTDQGEDQPSGEQR